MAKQGAAKKNSGKGKQPARKPILPKKKPDTGGRKEAKKNIFVRFANYLRGVRSELKKVIWPKRPEVISSTLIVLVTLIVLALFVMGLDKVSEFFINLITGGAQLPT